MNKNIIHKNWFLDWQNETIFSYKYGDIPRKTAIHIFIKEGYIPFIFKKGYCLNKHMETFSNTLASMLFFYYTNNYYHLGPGTNNNNSNEHWQHYNHIIEYEEWNSFLEYWDTIFNELFSNGNNNILGDLIVLAYQYIDLEKSSTYLKYLEDNYNESDDEVTKKEKNIDPYILDQMNKYTSFKNNRKEE